MAKITKQEIITLGKKQSREAAIQANTLTISFHRVHKSKKAYTRKPKYREIYA